LKDLDVVCENRFGRLLGCIRSAFDDVDLIGSDWDTAFHVGFEFSPEPSSLSAGPPALWQHESSASSQLDAAGSGAGAELVELGCVQRVHFFWNEPILVG